MKAQSQLLFGALLSITMFGVLVAAGRTSAGEPEPQWEYAILELNETSYWGSLEKDHDLLWLTPKGGREGVVRASDPDKKRMTCILPGEYFTAIGGKAQPVGTEASLLTEIGRQGWQLVHQRNDTQETTMGGLGDKPDRKATIRRVERTFMRRIQ